MFWHFNEYYYHDEYGVLFESYDWVWNELNKVFTLLNFTVKEELKKNTSTCRRLADYVVYNDLFVIIFACYCINSSSSNLPDRARFWVYFFFPAETGDGWSFWATVFIQNFDVQKVLTLSQFGLSLNDSWYRFFKISSFYHYPRVFCVDLFFIHLYLPASRKSRLF